MKSQRTTTRLHAKTPNVSRIQPQKIALALLVAQTQRLFQQPARALPPRGFLLGRLLDAGPGGLASTVAMAGVQNPSPERTSRFDTLNGQMRCEAVF